MCIRDSLGHLDYICRYGPYVDKQVNHQRYQSIIDDIFQTLIQKGKGIEVNTSGYKDRKTCGFPTFEQVERYYQMGGRIITAVSYTHLDVYKRQVWLLLLIII